MLIDSSERGHTSSSRSSSALSVSSLSLLNNYIANLLNQSVEAAGYIARIFSHFDTLALGPYIVQTMLILVAPPLFAASIYMTLGRLIREMGAESASLVRVKWVTKIFVVGDVISFVLQCGGAFSPSP